MANKKGLVQQVADSIYQMILTEKNTTPAIGFRVKIYSPHS